MNRISRFVVLVTAIASLAAVMSSTAGAVTWHNTGDTAFTATAGAGTLAATGVSLTCPSGTGTGTLGSAPTVGHTITVSGTVHYNGCLTAGIATTIECGYTLTGTSQTGSTGHLVTSGNIDVTCSLTQFGAKLCHIENHSPLTGSYANPTTNAAPGRLTVSAGVLRVTNGPTGSCPLGSNDTATLTEQTFVVTTATGGPVPHTGPIVTRTA